MIGLTVLALSPHADDAELGAGGMIARLALSRIRVVYVPLSFAHQPELLTECRQALAILGAEMCDEPLGFTRRNFPQLRQEILDYLLELKKSLQPDLVLVTARADKHQDHQTVTDEALRAFKHTTILGYELPHNHVANLFRPACLVRLEENHLALKLKATQCYKSQLWHSYFDADYLIGLAKVRGVQAGAQYAEAFEVLRWIY